MFYGRRPRAHACPDMGVPHFCHIEGGRTEGGRGAEQANTFVQY